MPDFLTIDQVLRIHSSLIANYGGLEGTRDNGLLSSAIAMPQAMYDGNWLHIDIFEMAAAYLFHLTKNHPFIDGNKRTGAACAIIFLAINDISIIVDEAGLVEITLDAVTNKAKKDTIAVFFRSLNQSA